MRALSFGSVCSGIGAAELAWSRIGWRCQFMSEIEAFPRTVLTHHYPRTPLHGDFTTIEAEQYSAIDVLVGGTPCQAFSVAGLRGGLADSRGNLALEFIKLAQRLRPRWIVWENVPGVFSSVSHDAPDPCQPPDDMEEGAEWVGEDEYDADESHALSCFLAGLSTVGYGLSYRGLDAQYAGLAQRRLRVLVVGYLGDWRPAAQVLFDRESLSGDPPPRRQPRQIITGTLEARTTGGGGGWGTDWMLGGGIVPGQRPGTDVPVPDLRNGVLDGGGNPGAELDGMPALRGVGTDRSALAFGGNNQSGPIDIATALNACGTASGRQDFETETFLVDIAHTLRARGFDASEDGTGRGTPLVPVAFDWKNSAGAPNSEETTMTLSAERTPAIAFSCKDDGQGAAEDLSPTLRGMGHGDSHQNGGGQMAVAFAETMAVRRLTPRECERLQGFPDDYTLVPVGRVLATTADQLAYLWETYPDLTEEDAVRLAADGPRYKALGNSMAVPEMLWIGHGIAAVDAVWGAA